MDKLKSFLSDAPRAIGDWLSKAAWHATDEDGMRTAILAAVIGFVAGALVL